MQTIESKIFNGIYTVSSPTGQHRTFRIATCRKGNLEGKRIVSLLVGPDNNTSYQGFGFITDNDRIAIWRKYRDGQYEKYANCLIEMIVNGPESHFKSLGMELRTDKRCLRCNRRLTTPESIDRGIGPECYGKMGIG